MLVRRFRITRKQTLINPTKQLQNFTMKSDEFKKRWTEDQISQEPNGKAYNLLIFNALAHSPFYIVTGLLATGLYYPFFEPVTLTRTATRSIFFMQAVYSGIHFGVIINQKEKYLTEQIEKGNDENLKEENLGKLANEMNRQIKFSMLPFVINFISSQILLIYSPISLGVLNGAFLAFFFSNSINLFITKKYFRQNSSEIRLNMVFLVINFLFYLILYMYLQSKITKGENPLKTVKDENRIENLKMVHEIEQSDTELMENENKDLMNNLDEEILDMDLIFDSEIEDKNKP